MSLYNLASGELKKENNKLKQEIQKLKGALQTHEILLQSNTKEIERLNNIIKQIEKCIDYYAIENEDFSKFYNNEEIEILKIIGSDKE